MRFSGTDTQDLAVSGGLRSDIWATQNEPPRASLKAGLGKF